MEIWAFGAASILALAFIVLLFCHLSLRRSIGEIGEELDEKMSIDTNTLISTSSVDPAIRRLAVQLNRQLRALRDERRRLQNGDMELKAAVTNISHDLRTPLTAISGYLDLLEREEMSENGRRYFAILRERADALKLLTEELFRYSVITSAAEELNLEPISLNAALEVSLAAFYGVLTEKNITPEIHLPDADVVRCLDQVALRRVLGNILNNAAKYSQGDLAVTLTEDGTITFSNRAGELSPVQAEKLFDRFYTVTSARNSTGLGLSIAKVLTERLGGSISATVRDGCLTITLRFPHGPPSPRRK